MTHFVRLDEIARSLRFFLRLCICTALFLTAFLTAGFSLAQTSFLSAQETERFGGSTLFTEQGYRIDRYRSPTPQHIDGVTTVDTDDLAALLTRNSDLIILDVINLTFRDGRFLLDEAHEALPGAHWLPNTGQGELESRWQHYLLEQTKRLTAGDYQHPVIVACKSDCWLSWNVALRLREAGYQSLYWYRDGVDTWQQMGLPTEHTLPVLPEFADY